MKRLILVAMLMAGCGGTPERPSLAGNWTLQIENAASAELSIRLMGDNPSENAFGFIAIGTEGAAAHGRAADDCLVTAQPPGLIYWEVVCNFIGEQTMSGTFCAHRNNADQLPSDCHVFIATRN